MTKTIMKVLSADEVELIHQSSLRILSEAGVKIDGPSVLDLLQEAGEQSLLSMKDGWG